MNRNPADNRCLEGVTSTEEIQLLYAISRVSARLARNLSFLATYQSEKGEKEYVKDGYNHQNPEGIDIRFFGTMEKSL